MPSVLCLAGPASPEKTLFLDALAAELVRRGLRLGVINPAPASPPPAPYEVALEMAPDGYRLRAQGGCQPSLDQAVARHGAELDLLLSQVHDQEKALKVEFCPPGAEPVLLKDPGLRALVCAQPREGKPPCFSPQEAAKLADYLVSEVLPQPRRPTARVLVDGRRLPTKEFVQDIVAATIRALIGSLKGGDKAEKLEIHL